MIKVTLASANISSILTGTVGIGFLIYGDIASGIFLLLLAVVLLFTLRRQSNKQKAAFDSSDVTEDNPQATTDNPLLPNRSDTDFPKQ